MPDEWSAELEGLKFGFGKFSKVKGNFCMEILWRLRKNFEI